MSTYNEESLMEEFNVLYEQTMLIMDSSSSDLESLIIEQEMESNLLQEAFLFHHSADNQSFSNYHYWTITHPFLSDDDNSHTSFRAMYRMNRSSFERLVNDLSLHSAFDLRAHNSTPAYIQISCIIWRLANCHIRYRMSNISFGVSHGSYMNFFRRTLIAIEGIYGNKISWPVNQERVEAIQTGFEWPHGQREGAVRRLPNIISALDGKNVIIESPRVHPEHWRDRKGHFSMKLTAVCDNKCRFIYIRVGDSGRTHDAAAFKWTDIFTMYLRNPETFFPSDGYILADSAYPFSHHVIVPYPSTETTGNSPNVITKRKFNKVHSSTRMSIERAFGLLSARWRFISKHVYIKDIKDICQTITAACILHNVCINFDDPDFDIEEAISNGEEDENEGTIRESACTRRDELNRWFNPL
ncbi:hypothetical protein INT48_007748 [Thamnidium elegans]|uniref:DDE Tnp4 domain-containing protein n=1 Tax=Thamnidium elegans TaxID=101142 RepID=A0A8H7SQ88_9FUNG|nr:hypothetical protein INT48_007748 [Thamnidium elegans]